MIGFINYLLVFIGAGTVGYFVVNRGLKIYDKWRTK